MPKKKKAYKTPEFREATFDEVEKLMWKLKRGKNSKKLYRQVWKMPSLSC